MIAYLILWWIHDRGSCMGPGGGGRQITLPNDVIGKLSLPCTSFKSQWWDVIGLCIQHCILLPGFINFLNPVTLWSPLSVTYTRLLQNNWVNFSVIASAFWGGILTWGGVKPQQGKLALKEHVHSTDVSRVWIPDNVNPPLLVFRAKDLLRRLAAQ